MDRVLNRVKYIALGVFAVMCAAVWAYQILYIEPQERCEASGRWWASEYRVCGTPVRLSRFTHRPDRAPAPPGTPGR